MRADGWQPTEEYRRKMSEVLTGRVLSEEHRHHMSEAWKLRLPASDETRRRMSESARARAATDEGRSRLSQAWVRREVSDKTRSKCRDAAKRRGPQSPVACHRASERWKADRNPKWRGGISSERGGWWGSEGRTFNRICRKRDDYRCQQCGKQFSKHSGVLHVHHRASWTVYPPLRSILANGVCFCYDCHISYLHSTEGEPLRAQMEADALRELGHLLTEQAA